MAGPQLETWTETAGSLSVARRRRTWTPSPLGLRPSAPPKAMHQDGDITPERELHTSRSPRDAAFTQLVTVPSGMCEV